MWRRENDLAGTERGVVLRAFSYTITGVGICISASAGGEKGERTRRQDML